MAIRLTILFFVALTMHLVMTACRRSDNPIIIDAGLSNFVAEIKAPDFGGYRPTFKVEPQGPGVVKVLMEVDISDTLRMDDWHLLIRPAFSPTFHWAPHLAPTSDHIIAQHVFRAPAMIVTDSSHFLALVPDLDLVGGEGQPNWYMDLDAPANTLSLGISRSAVKEHVLFRRAPGQKISPGIFRLGFYLFTSTDACGTGRSLANTTGLHV